MSVPVRRTAARRVGIARLAGTRSVTVIGTIARPVARSVAVSRWVNPRPVAGSIPRSVTIARLVAGPVAIARLVAGPITTARPIARAVPFPRLARSVAVSGTVPRSVTRPIAVAWSITRSITRFADTGPIRSRLSGSRRIWYKCIGSIFLFPAPGRPPPGLPAPGLPGPGTG